MKLKSVTIKNYKSVRQDAMIDLSQSDAPYTFIGKNGSGKTNLLKAVRAAFTHDRWREDGSYFTLKLDNSEQKRYRNAVKIKGYELKIRHRDNSQFYDLPHDDWAGFLMFNGKNLPNRRKLKPYADELEALLSQFAEKLEEYNKLYEEIESNLAGTGSFGRIYYNSLRHPQNYKEEMEACLKFLKSAESMTFREFNKEYHYKYRYNDFKLEDNGNFSIKFDKIRIPEEVMRLLGKSQDDIAEATEKWREVIDGYNAALAEKYAELLKISEACELLKERLEKDFEEDELAYKENGKENLQRFKELAEVMEGFIGKKYFLDNEESLLFGGSHYSDYSRSENLNISGPYQVLNEFLMSEGLMESGERLSEISKISDERLEKMVACINEKFLAAVLPKFDRDEICGLELTIEKKEGDKPRQLLSLNVIERDGTAVSFYDTSLGRRWYLTYVFIKAVLKPNDFLFLDEPAAFLHPSAVAEVRKELDELAKSGVRVFISTHNPYMLPEKRPVNIFNVRMTEQGTVVDRIDASEKLTDAANALGLLKTADILLNLSKTILLVEGVNDEACVRKFADLLGYDISGYHIHSCDGDSIIHVAYVCSEINANFQAIMDNDNHYKNDDYVRMHPGYVECLRKISEDGRCVFIGEGEDGCLEKLFAEEDTNFFTRKKVNRVKIDAIESKEELSPQTLKNFEEIFIKLGLSRIDEIAR